ncbi:CCA tRNA nucleotidyltransferase [Cohnella faecalis]|uniref:CCA tRNA nucleotidyltransferase n=1 Tax=Cohnella faecalis TaxID=2315694 RepID=A0A398CY12_9BACL|nr:CCA tRNA nucleotidyltransferase [Cohnella faecalis]RIE04677.1 CCA tRNA nucleotidyltransferase [Cohnella faecalis]
MAAVDGEALWAAGLAVVRRLREAGFEAFLVGGCVRDRLLRRAVHDIDIATSALPEEVMSTFARTLPTGLQHGTVTVMENGVPFEVTTYRHETGYSDGRRPDEVTFVRDIREDLARRDFTMNAIAVGFEGETIDPFGGERDLSAGLIRCVGDADSRFGEDALRMLRAVRFAAVLDFRLALSTWRGIKRQRERLKHVAMERVAAEWDKLMASDKPDRGAALLIRSGLLANVKDPLPDTLASVKPDAIDIRWHCVKECRLSEADDIDVRWAAFLSAAGCGADEAEQLCRKLRLSSQRTKRISGVIGFDRLWSDRLMAVAGSAGKKAFDETANEQANAVQLSSLRASWVKLALRFGRSTAEDWLKMTKCRPVAYSLLAYAKDWTNEISVWKAAELAVRGDELSRSLAKAPGPWIAELLNELLELVALDRLGNDSESLLAAARAQMDGGNAS